jgi:hypothetical protein
MKGIDIGDRISDLNKQGANISYMRNPIDSGIESYEDYEKHNKKFIPSWNAKGLISPFNESGIFGEDEYTEDEQSKFRELYASFENDVKEVFLEFEENGWYWKMTQDSISQYGYPAFNCQMFLRDGDWFGIEADIVLSGSMKDGEITWDMKSGENNEELASDFLTAIERLGETGVEFRFSFNTKGLSRLSSYIIIHGSV